MYGGIVPTSMVPTIVFVMSREYAHNGLYMIFNYLLHLGILAMFSTF